MAPSATESVMSYLIIASACTFCQFFYNCSSEVPAHDKVDDWIEDGVDEGKKKQTNSSPENKKHVLL